MSPTVSVLAFLHLVTSLLTAHADVQSSTIISEEAYNNLHPNDAVKSRLHVKSKSAPLTGCEVTARHLDTELVRNKPITVNCKSSCTHMDETTAGWQVYGYGPFRDDSSICKAAFNAGVIGHNGGMATLLFAGQEPNFLPYAATIETTFCFKGMKRSCAFASLVTVPPESSRIRTSTPTHTPTTRIPTAVPSPTPTEPPTHSPTLTPTEAPTTRPPSPSPSHTPTEIPTPSPTLTPTELPTEPPTTTWRQVGKGVGFCRGAPSSSYNNIRTGTKGLKNVIPLCKAACLKDSGCVAIEASDHGGCERWHSMPTYASGDKGGSCQAIDKSDFV